MLCCLFYVARPINRFRDSWYVLHLGASFWRVTETTKSVHTWLKTPGAFTYTKILGELKPETLSDLMLRHKSGKVSAQSLLADKDLPREVRTALNALHQSTSAVVGSDGHRRLLQKEGVAYNLCFGPPLEFVTPNLADTRQPLLLVVQGHEFRLGDDLPAYREMTERLASDPVGQAIVFEVMIRMFFKHVLGVREEWVGLRRGEARRKTAQWYTDGCATSTLDLGICGPVLAARGEVEAQGRGSLHPHILVWLVLLNHRELLDRLLRDQDTFRARLRTWMLSLVEAVLSVQQSSVQTLPLMVEDPAAANASFNVVSPRLGRQQPRALNEDLVPPLPFGPNEKRNFWADGERETATGEEVEMQPNTEPVPLFFYRPDKKDDEVWAEATRADLPLRNDRGALVDRTQWDRECEATSKAFWNTPINKSAAGSLPAYRLPFSGECHSCEGMEEIRAAVPPDSWFKEMCHDARDLVIGAAIHVCSPSCWKYHSQGANHICRHGFYHVITLLDEEWREVRRRRKGKALRACIAIVRDTRFGMAGRILTYQLHPFECPTNYPALVAMRCNVDVQDLRRVLPPKNWLEPEELEPSTDEGDAKDYMHGAYPQRLSQFVVDAGEEWGWMRHLGTVAHSEHSVLVGQDWHGIFTTLLHAARPTETSVKDAMETARAASVAIFVDAHNTGYYINSYTTKLNPAMDNVLRRLLDGLRRQQEDWRKQLEMETEKASKRGSGFKQRAQLLGRFETAFRRASWKSGCEMAFPILFGHLSFSTHRCWCVFMRKSIYCAKEAWRMAYGQIATGGGAPAEAQLTFKVPEDPPELLQGWHKEVRDAVDVYIGPEGQELNAVAYAQLVVEETAQEDPEVQVPAKAKKLLQPLEYFRKKMQDMKEGDHEELLEDATTSRTGKATYHTMSQLDDWLHRGDHEVLRPMSLYVYSMWVYRAELSHRAAGGLEYKKNPTPPMHVDFDFEPTYPGASTWTQRIATEPRVPRPEGFQFVSESQDPETHFMLKSVLLQPLFLEPWDEEERDDRQLRIIETFKQLCVPRAEGEEWPALFGGPRSLGPFQRSYQAFIAKQQELADKAKRKSLQGPCPRWASLWETTEMQGELEMLAEEYKRITAAAGGIEAEDLDHEADSAGYADAQPRITTEEYCAIMALQVDGNFDGIAAARSEKPKRQIDEDRNIKEKPARVEGASGDDALGAQEAGASERARLGLGSLGQSLVIAHYFNKQTLEEVLSFETRERRTPFSKELSKQSLMKDGRLPEPLSADAARWRQALQENVIQPYCSNAQPGAGGGLGALSAVALQKAIEMQREHFNQVGELVIRADDDDVDGPPPSVAAAPVSSSLPARFAPGDQFRRPSDLVAFQAEQFEKGLTGPPPLPGQPPRTKQLTRDQVLFLAQFSKACNKAWDDELNEKRMAERKPCILLLMGQGGSGKTALIQEIVLPVLDALFPKDESFNPPQTSLIVCSSWAQAENISTPEHKALSCHTACHMRVQGEYRNKSMLPGEKQSLLEQRWGNKRCLIVEEVSLISPELLNMVLYRSFHGRREHWAVPENQYDKPQGAFGRMPIVIYLGDFLQLPPVAAHSLLDDMSKSSKEIPPEYQMASKLLRANPLCFELRVTNRFKDEKLKKLMAFMRSPQLTLPADIRQYWLDIQAQDSDPRLLADRFQTGHMLAIYWETAARWVMMRARRDAAALKTPLFLIQAADSADRHMPRDDCAKLVSQYNPYETGHMHGMLGVHLGMRVRLLAPLHKSKGLVQDAEGTVVHVAVNPKDQAAVDEALAPDSSKKEVYLKHVPLGLWVRFDKYVNSPFQQELGDADASLTAPLTQSLVFVEPSKPERPFKWRGYTIHRFGFALSHAQVRTSQSCQGKTLKGGVIIDCARRQSGNHQMDDDKWWLHLYVMLSRATSLDDLLLLRAPEPEFLLRGPPKDLLKALQDFATRVEGCRKTAKTLANKLGLHRFLR